MKKVQLVHGRVELGQPLPFDLFDEHGRVLLKYGYVCNSRDQLNRLIERGVFFNEIIEDEKQQQQETEKISVYLRVGELAGTYEGLMNAKMSGGEILNIAGHIQELCRLDSDAALANILLRKSGRYSLRHSFHTAVMSEVLLRSLGCPEEARRYAIAGALTMNVGMLELQDELYSQNTPLTLDQKRAVVLHPKEGTGILREQGIDHPVWLDVVEHHHEMIDGSGYPKRLLKDDLSIESQSVSLADRYCAMVSERKHRVGVLPNVAAKDLLSRQSATIGQTLAAAFIKEIGSYPPGTVVSLANGEMAVVVKRLLSPDQPMVRSLRTPSGIHHAEPPKRVTSGPIYAIKEVLCSDQVKNFDLAALWHSIQMEEGATAAC